MQTVVSGAGGVVWSVAFAPDGRFFTFATDGHLYATMATRA